METKVRVIVRFRPAESSETCHSASDNQICLRVPAKKLTFDFEFDRVYENSTQEAIFNENMLPLLDAFLGGINCTVLAYVSS